MLDLRVQTLTLVYTSGLHFLKRQILSYDFLPGLRLANPSVAAARRANSRMQRHTAFTNFQLTFWLFSPWLIPLLLLSAGPTAACSITVLLCALAMLLLVHTLLLYCPDFTDCQRNLPSLIQRHNSCTEFQLPEEPSKLDPEAQLLHRVRLKTQTNRPRSPDHQSTDCRGLWYGAVQCGAQLHAPSGDSPHCMRSSLLHEGAGVGLQLLSSFFTALHATQQSWNKTCNPSCIKQQPHAPDS
eukprot:1148785-Pelagomonas_calceolata.AAC.3